MQVGKHSNLTPCIVTSKYFTNSPVMDESLSDFQEKKVQCTGPKKSGKLVSNKTKPKTKNLKRIRGQKDIRSALKSKKNELIAYTNEFDKVCKQSGIDIDPEQLQLAIALSKSLQQGDCDTQSSIPSTSQERSGKIRTTLLEYGFKVPDAKVTSSRGKKLKHRKHYKLIIATDAEKKQIISDKYSQVLFQNTNNQITHTVQLFDAVSSSLYHKATNSTYEVLKQGSSFNVDNLVEILPNSVGSLLRDWSDIPGRPISPTVETTNINISDIEFTQEELNCVLSGTVVAAQKIIKSKVQLLQNVPYDAAMSGDAEDMNMDKYDNRTPPKVCFIKIDDDNEKRSNTEEINRTACQSLKINAPVRSYSPDIFDDEVSVLDNSIDDKLLNHGTNTKHFTRDNDVMDLTECVNIKSQKVLVNETIIQQSLVGKRNDGIEILTSQSSQGSDVTKRRSNDFMEMTDCVAGSSQPLLIHPKTNPAMHTVCSNGELVNVDNGAETVDLTQSSGSEDDSLPFVEIGGIDKSLDDTIILNPLNYEHHNDNKTNSSREVLIPLENCKTVNESTVTTEAISVERDSELEPIKPLEHYNNANDLIDKDYKSRENVSFFDEYIHNHSDDRPEEHSIVNLSPEMEGKLKADAEPNVSETYTNDIDLTQDSNDSAKSDNLTHSTDSDKETEVVNIQDQNKDIFETISPRALGKNDDVSIENDEMFDNIVQSLTTEPKSNTKFTDSNSDINSSQQSEVFEISDKEFDYSINKSKHENFEIGGLSIMDDLSNARASRSTGRSIDKLNYLANETFHRDSYLPEVNLGGPKVKSLIDSQPSTSKCNLQLRTETPVNKNYVIKTDNVTPMLDYTSLTTPERNTELDKYGIKPLKRRRAIQILSHIYNQTHPLVESCSIDELGSPSKKQKIEASDTQPQEKGSKFQVRAAKSPKKVLEEDNARAYKENDVYDVTSHVPVIRDLECGEEDWVFQKREKAKVHSCRVPLHISLHNYVSTRRRLRCAILRYEPVDIDAIHRGLVANGCRYDPKDLLKYMDKKCITVKTVDNNARNKKHH